jgi:hypothetical protein
MALQIGDTREPSPTIGQEGLKTGMRVVRMYHMGGVAEVCQDGGVPEDRVGGAS